MENIITAVIAYRVKTGFKCCRMWHFVLRSGVCYISKVHGTVNLQG